MRLLLLVPLLLAATLFAPAAASASSLQLDGVDDYAGAGYDPSAGNLTRARTWEAWVKTTRSSPFNDYDAIFQRYRNGQDTEGWSLHLRQGVPEMSIGANISHGGPNSYMRANVAVNDGQWHHIAAVWVPGSRLDIYVDGVKHNGTSGGYPTTAVMSQLLTLNPDVPMRIGVGSFQGNELYRPFDGAIDGVRYSRVARYGEADFTPALHPAADADTIALWNFDEGEGTSAANQAAPGAAATLYNGAGWTFGPIAP